MSVSISNLNKYYGNQHVLKGISLDIPSIGVTGLLGPNGAGKSTIMKILSGLISPTSGSASVNGFDVCSQTNEVKKIIGYLPEHNPLYTEMYVVEFLTMTADVYRVKNKKMAVLEAIGRTGLQTEKKKKIRELSKGYKQRVGLAQNLLHNPHVLILDEPTTGLDPNQLIEIRQLIKDLGKDKTVILSTHIMQEVEAVCSNVVIINKGSIVANGNLDTLKNISGNSVIIEFAEHVHASIFDNVEFISSVNLNPVGGFAVKASEDKDIRADLFNFAVENDLTIISMSQQEHKLEDVFKQLTN